MTVINWILGICIYEAFIHYIKTTMEMVMKKIILLSIEDLNNVC